MKAYGVGDAVFASVKGFIPFPAVVENVLLNESDCAVFYYVRLLGASKIVPMDAENLQPIHGNKHKYKLSYTEKEIRKESKLRVDALLGAEDDVPDVLMNFVTVDSDFEEVSNEDVKRLGLCSIMLTPSMVHKLNAFHVPENVKTDNDSDGDDDFVDVEEVQQDSDSKNLIKNLISQNSFSCATCPRSYKTKRALRIHKMRSLLCNNARLQEGVQTESMKSHVKKSEQRSKQKTHTKSTFDPNLNKKVEELIQKDKSRWSNRPASGFFPCKLCFRKFRSKAEVRSHMVSHHPRLSQKEPEFTKNVKVPSIPPSESDGSYSNEEMDGRSSSKHCSMERERRAELAAKFAELATSVGLESNPSKVRTLEMARLRINELHKESEELIELMAQLEDQNMRLTARVMELNP